MIAVFLDVLLISLVFNLCLFLVAYFFQTDKLTDLSYSLSFIAVGTYAVFRFNTDSLFHKLLLALVILWALRLGSYLFIRVHKMGRDKRFDGIREKFISFLGFWIMQGVSVAIIINALSFASWYGDLNPGYLSYALVILSLLALILEAVADHQKFTFKIKQPSRFMQTGLWKKIRHAEYPSVFLRYLDSFVGHNNNIVRPPESEKLDYEGEIVIIIGKGGRRIPKENALNHIAGLSLMNEGTIRDWVRHAKFNVTQGKNFDNTGVIGPWMMTADEVEDYTNLDIQTRVNGEVRQDDNTSNLMFPFDYIISYLSTFMTLKPGDMISTGTPNGAGARFDPPIYLKPGDIVEVEAAGVGILRNGVEDERL